MVIIGDETPATRKPTGADPSTQDRHALREQDMLWAEFLAMARAVVELAGQGRSTHSVTAASS